MGVTAKVLENGEVLLPAEIAERLGWKAGAELEVVRRGGDVVVRPIRDEPRRDDPFPPITLEEFFARTPKYTGPPVTDEDIEAAVLDEAKRRWNAKSG